MNAPKPQFKSALLRQAPNFEAINAVIDQVATKNDIGSIVKPSDQAPSTASEPNVTTLPKKEKAPRKPQRAEERKLTVMMP